MNIRPRNSIANTHSLGVGPGHADRRVQPAPLPVPLLRSLATHGPRTGFSSAISRMFHLLQNTHGFVGRVAPALTGAPPQPAPTRLQGPLGQGRGGQPRPRVGLPSDGGGLSPVSRPQGPSLAPFTGMPLPSPSPAQPWPASLCWGWGKAAPRCNLCPLHLQRRPRGTGPAHARRNTRVSHGGGQARKGGAGKNRFLQQGRGGGGGSSRAMEGCVDLGITQPAELSSGL